MARPPRPLLVLLLAAPLPGCVLLFPEHTDPASVQRRFEEERLKPPDDGPQKRFVFQGEIRDFATFRLEPAAILEFWSERPGYAPDVALDGRGGYTARVDACRRTLADEGRPTAGEVAADVVNELLMRIPARSSASCSEWIGKFGLRARLGDRCSFAVSDEPPPASGGSLVLWLHDCQEPAREAHHWRQLRGNAGR
jgi:hypothetical protein